MLYVPQLLDGPPKDQDYIRSSCAQQGASNTSLSSSSFHSSSVMSWVLFISYTTLIGSTSDKFMNESSKFSWCSEPNSIECFHDFQPFGSFGQNANCLIEMAPEKWLEGATKMDGQFSGGHVKWAPETTKAEVKQ